MVITPSQVSSLSSASLCLFPKLLTWRRAQVSTGFLQSQAHHRNLTPETHYVRARILPHHQNPLESPSVWMKQPAGHWREAGGWVGMYFIKGSKSN